MLLPSLDRKCILTNNNYEKCLNEQEWGFDEWLKVENSDILMYTCNLLQLYETKIPKRQYDLDSFLEIFL